MKYSTFTKIASLWPILLLIITVFSSCNLNPGQNENKVSDDPYNGVRKNYSKKGILLSTITYKDSVANGVAQNYYENGKVQAEFNYRNGLKHGDEKIYYENGDLYMITQYVNNVKSGIQKVYYPENQLQAEIPWESGEVVAGLKEYTKSGKLKNQDLTIQFKLIDKTAFENKFELKMSLSDGSKVATFERLFLDDKGKVIGRSVVESKGGEGTISFWLMPGRSMMEKLYFRGTRKTSLRNIEIIEGTYNLAIENRKQYN